MSSSDTSTAASVKSCCSCGADVAGKPRMKDSHGKYWCMSCGEADQRRKLVAATHLACAGCRKPFPKGKLDKHGDYFFCKPCLKVRKKGTAVGMPGITASASAPASGIAARTSHGGGGAAVASQGGDKRRVVMMTALLVTLVLLSVLFNLFFAE